MTDQPSLRKESVEINAPMLGGFAAVATVVHALHCVKAMGEYVSKCNCASTAEAFSFVYGLDGVVVAGLLVHGGALFGLLAAGTVFVRTHLWSRSAKR